MYITGLVYSISIFISYLLLIVILSSFVLKPAVKGERIFKRFIIYIVFGNFYISTIVFILAYLNIFNRFSLISSLIFISILIRIFLDRKEFKLKIINTKEVLGNLILGKYGFKLFLWRMTRKAIENIKDLFHQLLDGKKIEWVIFLSILAYNVYQYGINNIQFVTYMAPDEEVHLYWIQSLIGGNIYPSGVYPHVFHNVITALIKTFNFNGMIYLRYFGATSYILIMTMLYIGLRKIFRSKYAALFGFMLYSILNMYSEEVTYRFQFSIPQEYAMIMLVPIAIFLFDYIEYKKIQDLIFFGIALSLSVSIHFYTGIIGIIIALSIGIVYLYKIIKEKIFLKLIICAILSGIIAIAPLGIGLALGHEMEPSMGWATGVIKGDIYTESIGNIDDEEILVEDKALTWDKFKDNAKVGIEDYVLKDINILYILLSIIVFTLILNAILLIAKKNDEKYTYQISFGLITLILVFLMLLKYLKLPTIMEISRVAIYFAYFSSVWMGMPIEILNSIFQRAKLKKTSSFISIGIIGMGLLLVLKLGLLRPIPPFYYFQTTGTVLTNMSIMKDYNDYTWTAISPVNNISQVLNRGFHYELNDFIILQENWNKEKKITIPTQYIFIYIEKRPIVKYGYRFKRDDIEIINRDFVKKEDGWKDLSNSTEENIHYKKERNILMAKAYYWAEEYKKYFPNEMNVYYEDSELIVYRIKQNIYALNNLAIDYGMNSR